MKIIILVCLAIFHVHRVTSSWPILLNDCSIIIIVFPFHQHSHTCLVLLLVLQTVPARTPSRTSDRMLWKKKVFINSWTRSDQTLVLFQVFALYLRQYFIQSIGFYYIFARSVFAFNFFIQINLFLQHSSLNKFISLPTWALIVNKNLFNNNKIIKYSSVRKDCCSNFISLKTKE